MSRSNPLRSPSLAHNQVSTTKPKKSGSEGAGSTKATASAKKSGK